MTCWHQRPLAAGRWPQQIGTLFIIQVPFCDKFGIFDMPVYACVFVYGPCEKCSVTVCICMCVLQKRRERNSRFRLQDFFKTKSVKETRDQDNNNIVDDRDTPEVISRMDNVQSTISKKEVTMTIGSSSPRPLNFLYIRDALFALGSLFCFSAFSN